MADLHCQPFQRRRHDAQGREIVGSARPNSKKCWKEWKKYFRKNFSFLNFWCGRWKISGRNFTGEIGVAVGAIAERLVGGMAAAAESDGCASGETEFISGEIDDFKIAFNQDWAVIFECDFCWH